eukprot:12235425-Alexandrium_andersonii.AAC.1
MRLLRARAHRQLWGSGLPRAAAPVQVTVSRLPSSTKHQTVPQASDVMAAQEADCALAAGHSRRRRQDTRRRSFA